VSSWGEFESDQPELAAVVRRCFDAGRHKTIATIRADGSPRISGIECSFEHGQMTFGSMVASRKLDDLRRDPRFALHSPTSGPIEGDEASWSGEAKVAGRAVPNGTIEGEGGPEGELFIADILEVVFVHLDETATKLIVDWWTPENGLQRVERA
jgi:Pyridoxamine 5'-phosphate oxidase